MFGAMFIPAVRGTPDFALPRISEAGLSPLARGTRTASSEHLFESRFIPADAGNTVSTSIAGLFPPVYPRWRGEH